VSAALAVTFALLISGSWALEEFTKLPRVRWAAEEAIRKIR
jgi:hypothetical protein